jgi:adenine-specific DNA-methyltransferase
MDKKRTGSYYTPERLSAFVADYCLEKLEGRDLVSILEPSAGDGSFIRAISDNAVKYRFQQITLTAVEKEIGPSKLVGGIGLSDRVSLRNVHTDYLNFHREDQELYSAVIGNPPYVKKNHLTEEQKVFAQEIHAEYELSGNSIKNIWTAFLVSGISKLEEEGVLAMILPLELLQVKFAGEIRKLLKREFTRLEIFTFDELQFLECKGQDTVLLIGYKVHNHPGTFYTNINHMAVLEERRFEFYQNIAVSDSERKWTHHFITPAEYEFLEGIRSRLAPVSNFVSNKAGIVTAANDFFIVPASFLALNDLDFYARPIIERGFFVNGAVSFTNEDFDHLAKSGRSAYLLDFNTLADIAISPRIAAYLQTGVNAEISERFKCKQRKKWYQIPNVGNAPEAFFFKRAHDYPKLLLNSAAALVTDSAYKVESMPGINIQDFVFSYYNSLTLVFAELEGRYYGGGVLELTPNEFRVLPIPYVHCEDFAYYETLFKTKASITDILDRYNYYILNTSLGLTAEEIARVEEIRIKLINKRKRKLVPDLG